MIEKLKFVLEGIDLFQAGLPDFPRNFTRDSLISAILMKDPEMLKNQLNFCALKQGIKNDPFTGEEPGKIFHEYPGVLWNGLNTEYNACDTTALFLIAHKFYKDLTKDESLIKNQKEIIEKSIQYIISHLNKDYLFFEDPKSCNAERFALKVTYWKDSEILGRENGDPVYPVVYTLAHIQNLAGIRAAIDILQTERYSEIEKKMKNALNLLFDKKLNSFFLAIDNLGAISGVSSDILHMLFYLEPEDLSQDFLNQIVILSRRLETSIGYQTLDPAIKIQDEYHSKTVWPFEQAIINAGAKKFNLVKIQEVSSRIVDHLNTDPEFFIVKGSRNERGGCDPQLWTIAAKEYFIRKKLEM